MRKCGCAELRPAALPQNAERGPPMVDATTPRPHATVWAGRRGRRSVALAARPDQVVRAVLAFDQAGVDRRRERRVIQGHRQIRPVRLADLLPRRVDLEVAGDDPVVRSVLALLGVRNELDLDVWTTFR